jgi:hypothetical protein
MKFFLADNVPYSITADSIRTISGIPWCLLLNYRGHKYANKNFHMKVAMDIVFQRNKKEFK